MGVGNRASLVKKGPRLRILKVVSAHLLDEEDTGVKVGGVYTEKG